MLPLSCSPILPLIGSALPPKFVCVCVICMCVCVGDSGPILIWQTLRRVLYSKVILCNRSDKFVLKFPS